MEDQAPRWARAGWALRVSSLLLPLFLALPLVSLVLRLDPRAWLEHVASPVALRAFVLTLETTAVATVLSAALGLPLAWLLARHRFRGSDVVDTLVALPVTIPPVVVGVALLMAFGRQGLVGRAFDLLGIHVAFTSVAVVMAQMTIASPFFVRAARAGFEAVDPALEHAALTLGASPWRVFWTVSVPLARPALFAGLVLCWARALSEFGATMMFAGNFPGRTQTLSLAVMSAMESDLDTAVAVASLSLLLGLAALLVARGAARRWWVAGG
jgi:molybdate transport system permease protein